MRWDPRPKPKPKKKRDNRSKPESQAPAPPDGAEKIKKLVSENRVLAGAALTVFAYAFLVALFRIYRRNKEQAKSKGIMEKIERTRTRVEELGASGDDLRPVVDVVIEEDVEHQHRWPEFFQQLKSMIAERRRGRR